MSLVLLTQAEAARMLRCSPAKLARERRLGRLAYIPGRPVMLRLEDVLEWLERRRITVKETVEVRRLKPAIAARRAVLRHHTHTKGKPHHA